MGIAKRYCEIWVREVRGSNPRTSTAKNGISSREEVTFLYEVSILSKRVSCLYFQGAGK